MILWFLLMIIILLILLSGIVLFFPFNLKGKSKKYSVITISIYALCQIILLGNMIYSIMFFKNISNTYAKNIMIFFSAVYFIIITYGSLLLLIRKILAFLLKKTKKKKALEVINSKKIVVCILILMSMVGIVGYTNASKINVKTYEISSEKELDKESYDIVMITDTHMGIGANKKSVDDIVKKTNKIEPDFIFLTGDIIDENTSDENANYILNAFSKMKSKYGIYAVLGNHESYRGGEADQLFKKYGINILQDEIQIANGITIVGRKDYYSNRDDFKNIVSKYEIDFSKPVIVLTHEPLEYNTLSEYDVDLVLSGHTHGEQFPGTYIFVKMANDMVYGLKKFNNMNAIVSSGVGEWGFHYTFPSKNEILHIKINGK